MKDKNYSKRHRVEVIIRVINEQGWEVRNGWKELVIADNRQQAVNEIKLELEEKYNHILELKVW